MPASESSEHNTALGTAATGEAKRSVRTLPDMHRAPSMVSAYVDSDVPALTMLCYCVGAIGWPYAS